jgi:signal transduction histidine kinase
MTTGLSAKIIGIFLLTSLCFFPALAYFSISATREHLEHAFLEKATTVARLIDSAILSDEDLEDAQKLFSTIQKSIWLDPDILCIDINLPADGQLKTVVSNWAERIGMSAGAANLKSYETGTVVHRFLRPNGARQVRLTAPIHSARQLLGTIQIDLTLEQVDREIREATNIAIVGFLGFVIAFVLVIFWFLRALVIEPIKKLGAAVRSFARGEAGYRLPLQSRDEIGELAAVFDQMTTDLEQTNEQLRQSQKMEAIGQLTGGVAHDFNNLLAVILGNAELLEHRSKDNRSLVRAILRAATRGAELTHRLTAFSRQQPLQPRPVDLAALVAGMSDILGRTLGETIEIETVAESGLWLARADSGQVENSLLNLAINARDAMAGGGKLTIECANAQLTEAHALHNSEALVGDYVTLAVSDTGAGMSDAVLERVFEPFFTTKDIGEGSGLGLSMVYGFARQSGGHVTINSAVGQGTTVKLYLPRWEGTAVRVEKAATDEVPRGRGEVVLVVEDDPDVRELAVKMLDGLGYSVIEAPTANTARTALDGAGGIDLVLSDVVLPAGTSGPAFVREARTRYPGLKAVFMSGHMGGVAKRNGLPGPVVLNKPFQRREIAEALRAALDER